MTGWLKRWRSKQRKMKLSLRDTYLYHILGERIFHHQVWEINANALAGGLSLGLFIAFTPTIPFQMLLCAAGALFLRVNLPVALAACWITNPFTALPIYLAARRLGRYLFEHSEIGMFILSFFSFENQTGKFMEQSLYLWVGSLVFSAGSALGGNVAVRVGWKVGHWLKARVLGGPKNKTC